MRNSERYFRPRPRDRIVDTARDLFRKHGLRGIGVDAIAETAGTNKMTLYRHFGSKDDLIVECLRGVAREGEEIWAEVEAAHPANPDGAAQCLDPLRRRAWPPAGAAATWRMRRSSWRKATTRRGVSSRSSRRKQRNRLAELAAPPASRKRNSWPTPWSFLEGARVSRQSVGAEGPCANFIASAEAVIASFLRGSPDGEQSASPRKVAGRMKPASRVA